MIMFHLVGSTALRHLDLLGEMTISLILLVVVLDIFFVMALMADLLVNVLIDIKDVNSKEQTQ